MQEFYNTYKEGKDFHNKSVKVLLPKNKWFNEFELNASLPQTIKKTLNLDLVNYELPSANMLSNAQSLAAIASKLSDKDDGTMLSREAWE